MWLCTYDYIENILQNYIYFFQVLNRASRFDFSDLAKNSQIWPYFWCTWKNQKICLIVKYVWCKDILRRPQNFAKSIFTLLLTVCTVVKSKVKILQNFVAFSEYMNYVDTRMFWHWWTQTAFDGFCCVIF